MYRKMARMIPPDHLTNIRVDGISYQSETVCTWSGPMGRHLEDQDEKTSCSRVVTEILCDCLADVCATVGYNGQG